MDQLALAATYSIVLPLIFSPPSVGALNYTRSHSNRDDSDDDSDSDSDSDDDDNDHNHSHHGSSAGNSGSLSKGAIAGIVIGIIVFLLLLFLLFLCWRRRRRAMSVSRRSDNIMAIPASEMSVVPRRQSHLANIPSSPDSNHVTSPLLGAPYLRSSFRPETTARARPESDDVLSHSPSTSAIHLPNPYDLYVADVVPVSLRPERMHDLALPASPVPTTTTRYSTIPSSWVFDSLLSRGTTQASRLTASSSLHEEMAQYQKELEVHHQKEEAGIEVPDASGSGSNAADPPPQYSAADA